MLQSRIHGPAALVAHTFGARYDLPVPLGLFLLGGAVVVFASFLLVLPRPVAATTTDPEEADALAPARPAPLRSAIAGLVVLALMVGGWRGSQEVSENLLPVAFWLLAWVALPISCGLLGDWTRTVNPFAALVRLGDHPGARRAILNGPALPWPAALGWWPVVILFLLAELGELVFNATATVPAVTAWLLLAYGAVCVLGGLLFGGIWLERGELFSVLFSTWGRLGWFRFGAPGRRGFGGGLSTPFEASAGRITFVLLLLAGVTYDGLLATPAWRTLRVHLPGGLSPGTAGYLALTTAGLLALVLLAWLLFGTFALLVRVAGRLELATPRVLAGLLPSLMPIALGYLIAHNAAYLATNAQLLIPLAGNPFGLGWHLLPAPFDDSYRVNPNLVPSSVIWYTQIALIVAVHVAAVLLAHRHLSRRTQDPQPARRAEWPWIVAMVGYTVTSLWLLAQPVVQEHGG